MQKEKVDLAIEMKVITQEQGKEYFEVLHKYAGVFLDKEKCATVEQVATNGSASQGRSQSIYFDAKEIG